MHTSRKEETSADEAALVPSASKFVKYTSRGETTLMSESLKRVSATTSYNTKSTHEATLVPHITAETVIHEAVVAPDAASKKKEMSINERTPVPHMTATAIVPPAEANYRRRKKTCSCCRNKLCCRITIVAVIVLVALLLFLKFYIFKARKPKTTSQDVKVKKLSFSIEPVSITLSLGINMGLKNPNYAGWKYKETNTTLYYHGPDVGLATVPAGVVNARSRASVNISVDVNTTEMTSSKYLIDDLRSGYLPLDTYTVMMGKVLIMKIIKIHATVYLNCSVTITLLTWETATKCKTKVHL